MYVKLFASLYQGTLRGRPNEILVFTNLLAHADRYGVVDKHWRAIAEETGLNHDEVQAAIQVLESPDAESRSPEREGRRIYRLDDHRAWGWQIVNYEKYRAIRSEDDRREQNRLAQERFRNKHSKPPSAYAEADAKAEALKPLAQTSLSDAETIYSFYPRKVGKAAAIKSIKASLKKESAEYLAQKTKAYAESPEVTERDLKMVPHPATWFNQERYHDEADWGKPKQGQATKTDTLRERNRKAAEGFRRNLGLAGTTPELLQK